MLFVIRVMIKMHVCKSDRTAADSYCCVITGCQARASTEMIEAVCEAKPIGKPAFVDLDSMPPVRDVQSQQSQATHSEKGNVRVVCTQFDRLYRFTLQDWPSRELSFPTGCYSAGWWHRVWDDDWNELPDLPPEHCSTLLALVSVE